MADGEVDSKAEINKANQVVERAIEEIERASLQLKEELREKEELKAKLNDLEQKLNKTECERDLARTEVGQTKNELEEELRKREELKAKLNDLEQQLNETKREKQLARAEVRLAKNELMHKEKEYNAAIKEMEYLKRTRVPLTSAPSTIEAHLNEILDYMKVTATNAGILLDKIYVRFVKRDQKNYVDIRGEINFLKGVTILNKAYRIKAVLYDANRNIEIEGSNYLDRSSFTGFDTFDIGWNGGTDAYWLTVSKIRLYVA